MASDLTDDQISYMHERAEETRRRWKQHAEDLEGKCHVLWLLNGGQTEEWNGARCDCEYIQGNLNCKRNKL